MVFADLKNDYIFRRIFGAHPDILRGLLNDLLERTGDRTIDHIDYLPSEQLPLVPGAKLSILDVRCKDRSGNKFVVEMQLIHVPGFLNRVIYNACKAYADQLGAGKPYANLTDVVAISICDFEFWPDAEQEDKTLCRVPMLSRWYVTERSLDRGDIPDDLPPGPYREALALANQAKFTQTELEAYRKAMDEIQQARDYGSAKEAEGIAKGVARALFAILRARGVPVGIEARARIDACNARSVGCACSYRNVGGGRAREHRTTRMT